MTALLEIKNLHAQVEDKAILKGINLTINEGEIHAIMCPNGAGKSTLSYVLAGHEDYEITEGQILFKGEDIREMDPHERANTGLFLAFQYPIEIPGVATSTFLRHAVNAKRKHNDLDEIDNMEFVKLMKEKAADLNITPDMLKRPVNTGYSGGEKKRAETLQMALLEPSMAILDETDSGLDIDALRIVADGVNKMRSPDRSVLMITHYQRLLDYIVPDYVHVLADGQIAKSGDKNLALELEEHGYAEFV